MSKGVNKAIIIGNLGSDPETKYTAGGSAVTHISVATSEDCFQNSLHGGDVSGAGYDVWVSLCHSFPKGVKGKYRQIVDSLTERGSGLFADLVDSFLQHYEEGSETAIRELLEDLSSDAIDLLKTQLEAEHASLIAELTK